MTQTPRACEWAGGEMHAHLMAGVPPGEIPKFDLIAIGEGFIPHLRRDERPETNAVPGSFQTEDDVLHRRKVAGHRPELAAGVDDGAIQSLAFYFRLAGDKVEVLHIGKVKGGQALQGANAQVYSPGIVCLAGCLGPISGHERPDGLVVINGHCPLLRPDDRRPVRSDGVIFQYRFRPGLVGDPKQDGERFAEQIVTVNADFIHPV